MEGSEYLFTCAEVGAALAGFSALVVAIRRDGDDVPYGYRELVSILIERSLVVVFLAFLPILLAGLGLSLPRVWLVASGLLGSYAASLAWRSRVRRKRDPGVSQLISGPMFTTLFVLGIFVIVVQVANATGIGVSQSVWWYLVGLTWMLASVGYLFYFTIRGWARSG